LPKRDWIDYHDGFFHRTRDEWVSLVEDPLASDGRAARMPGTHHEWAVQCYFADELEYGNPWRVYVSVRCETEEANGGVLHMGIYDRKSKKLLSHRGVKAHQVAADRYTVVELGAHDLDARTYAWVATRNRPGVEAVYVDRVFLVRGKAMSE
jgi:hypothetical protein